MKMEILEFRGGLSTKAMGLSVIPLIIAYLLFRAGLKYWGLFYEAAYKLLFGIIPIVFAIFLLLALIVIVLNSLAVQVVVNPLRFSYRDAKSSVETSWSALNIVRNSSKMLPHITLNDGRHMVKIYQPLFPAYEDLWSYIRKVREEMGKPLY